MRNRKNILIVVIALTVSLAAQSALAGGFSITASFGHPSFGHRSHGRGGIVSFRYGHGFPSIHKPVYRGPHYRRVIVSPPVHRRIVKICPPPVVISSPPVVVSTPVEVVTPANVTVWFTNSNGSQLSVELIPSGPGYIGPKGEYYPSMPTGEQLRMVYGF